MQDWQLQLYSEKHYLFDVKFEILENSICIKILKIATEVAFYSVLIIGMCVRPLDSVVISFP